MNYQNLEQLNTKLFFTPKDTATILNIKYFSAKVLCSRYTKQGIFVRLKKNFYILANKLNSLSKEELFQISNILQTPSYISLMTALSYYEITTQVQNNFIESISIKRSINFSIKNLFFNFSKINKKLYFDFNKKNNFFIATKEKAFIDAIYLYSFGKYKIDFDSLDLNKLDKEKITGIIKIYPQKTRSIIKKLCKI